MNKLECNKDTNGAANDVPYEERTCDVGHNLVLIESWACSPILRYKKNYIEQTNGVEITRIGERAPTLQQSWIECFSGKQEWRDVPIEP
jgi:hypothetical protein